MPVVPTRDAPSTTRQVGFTARVDSGVISPDAAATSGRQLQQFGQAVSGAAGKFIDIKVDAQKAANELRVADAVNKARQAALDAAYDPENGYLKLKGDSALTRPDGKSLVDEYGGKYDQSISAIEAELGNDAQKQAFKLQAQQLSSGFRGDLQKHMLTEYTNYHTSVADGTIKLAQQEAALNYDNPAKIDAAIYGVEDPETKQRTGGLRQAIYNKAKLTGASANETEAVMADAESAVHSNVILAALANNKTGYATTYFEQKKGSMVAADILKVQAQLNAQMDANVASKAVQEATKEYASAFQPTDMDRLTNIILKQESGGKRHDANGNIITSPKGAMGEMQIMPDTLRDPGFGMEKLAANDPRLKDPDFMAQRATQYLDKMVKRYGDVRLATAAYNAGPGAVDKALKDAKADGKPEAWLSYLPQETQNYATDAVNAFAAGGGRQPIPSKVEMVNAAVGKVGENPRAEAIKLARDAAEKQYELLVDARKTQTENALSAAQQELLQNGGDVLGLSPTTRMALNSADPEAMSKVTEFAKAIVNPVATNPQAYAQVVLNTEEVASMPQPVFEHFLRTNFDAAAQKEVLKMVQDYRSGATDNSPGSINSAALNTALEGRLSSIGVNPKPSKGWFGNEEDYNAAMAKVGDIQRIIRTNIYQQQRQLGRKLSPEELEQHLDRMFTKSVPLKQALFGVDSLWPDGNKRVMQLTADDIPNTDYLKIKRNLQIKGVANPDDALILRTYQNWKLNSNG